MDPKTEIVIDFMKANLHRKLSLDDLARSAILSGSHLWRLLKAETGMSPGQYLQKLRMEMACKLLTTTRMSVKQILLEVGYSDKGLFARHFKKAQGLTPSEYRAKCFDLIMTKDYLARQERNAS